MPVVLAQVIGGATQYSFPTYPIFGNCGAMVRQMPDYAAPASPMIHGSSRSFTSIASRFSTSSFCKIDET